MNHINNNSQNSNYTNPTGDVYAAPSTKTSIPPAVNTTQYDTSPWYSIDGRIGRVQYLAYAGIWFFIFIVIIFAALTLNSTIFYVVLGIPMIIVWFYSAVFIPRRRLHDLNRSGWFLLLNLVPVVSFLLALYMLFMPGDEGFNDYGHAPQPYTKVQLGLAFLIPIVTTVALIGVATTSMQSYENYFNAMNAANEPSTSDEVDASIEARIAEIQAQMDEQNNESEPSSDSYTDDVQINEGSNLTMPDGSDEGVTDVQIMNDAGNSSVDQQMSDAEAEIQAAIDEAINGSESTQMSFEEFMNSDSEILVE